MKKLAIHRSTNRTKDRQLRLDRLFRKTVSGSPSFFRSRGVVSPTIVDSS